MSDGEDTTTPLRPPRTPPLTQEKRDQLAQRQEEEKEGTGVEAVRAALDRARDALDAADEALDAIEAEAR